MLRPSRGPHRESAPFLGVTVSLIGHTLVLGALTLTAGLWASPERSKIYVVNLVAGLGSPSSAVSPAPKPQASTPPASRPETPSAPREPAQQPNFPPLPPASKPATQAPPRTVLSPVEELDLSRRLARAPRPRELPVTGLAPLERDRASPPQRFTEASPRREPPTIGLDDRKPVPIWPTQAARSRASPATRERPGQEKDVPERAARPAAAPAPTAGQGISPPASQPRAASAAPGPSSGPSAVSAEVSDFPFTWYLSRVQLKVAERWTEQPRISEPPQRPFIFVEILRDGSIKTPRIERSSGNTFYDQAALRAVTEASPFPPLPQEWNRPSLRILFGFELPGGRG